MDADEGELPVKSIWNDSKAYNVYNNYIGYNLADMLLARAA